MNNEEYQIFEKVKENEKLVLESEDGKETLFELTPKQLKNLKYLKLETKDGECLELDFLHKPKISKKEDEKESTKYQFLNNLIEEDWNCMDDIGNAFSLLDEFYDRLPKKSKTKEREKAYYLLADMFRDALKIQLQTLSKHPFVKIEVVDKEELEQDKKVLEWCKKNMCLMEGYVDRMSSDLRKLQVAFDNLSEGKHERREVGA